jgi:hypothetical protein
MNEMDLLTKLRDDVPRTPVPARVEELVLTAMTTHPAERVGVRSARRGISRIGALRPAWRLAVAAGMAVALAAGITVASLSQTGGSGVVTAELLADRAAATALSGPSVRPDHWVYRKVACGGYLYVLSWLTTSCPGGTLDTWATADSTKVAYFLDGKLQVESVAAYYGRIKFPPPQAVTDYSARASLPADPRALVTRLGSYLGGAAEDRAYGTFEIIGQWLAFYFPGPALTAELYRALADIPGVRADRHAVTTDGQPGVGFTLPLPTHTQHDLIHGWTQIIISPKTYQFLGLKSWDSTSRSIMGTSLLRETLVSGPGVLP